MEKHVIVVALQINIKILLIKDFVLIVINLVKDVVNLQLMIVCNVNSYTYKKVDVLVIVQEVFIKIFHLGDANHAITLVILANSLQQIVQHVF